MVLSFIIQIQVFVTLQFCSSLLGLQLQAHNYADWGYYFQPLYESIFIFVFVIDDTSFHPKAERKLI